MIVDSAYVNNTGSTTRKPNTILLQFIDILEIKELLRYVQITSFLLAFLYDKF